MKCLQHIAASSGYHHYCLQEIQDSGILCIQETGESLHSMDLAILIDQQWHEGRCYEAFDAAGPFLMTNRDARRVPLQAGMSVRIPAYHLDGAQIVQIAQAYIQDFGYTPLKDGMIAGNQQALEAPGMIDIPFPVEEDQTMIKVTVHLQSNGDIRVLADCEEILSSPPLGNTDR